MGGGDIIYRENNLFTFHTQILYFQVFTLIEMAFHVFMYKPMQAQSDGQPRTVYPPPLYLTLPLPPSGIFPCGLWVMDGNTIPSQIAHQFGPNRSFSAPIRFVFSKLVRRTLSLTVAFGGDARGI
jgi:hypothetical protein